MILTYENVLPTLRNQLPSETTAHLKESDGMLHDVAAALSSRENSTETCLIALEEFSALFDQAILKKLKSKKDAQKNHHIPESYYHAGQQSLLFDLDLAAQAKHTLLESILDTSGESARAKRPSTSELDRVLSLYDPKHPEDFSLMAPTMYGWFGAIAEYQHSRAPYRGLTKKLNSEFYSIYPEVPERLQTVSSEIDRRQAESEALDHLVYFRNVDTGYFGVGAGRAEKYVAEKINSSRAPNVTRMFSNANKHPGHFGFDVYPSSQSPDWLTKYFQIPLEDLYKHSELKGILLQAFAFGSPFMDILEISKRLEAYLGISHTLKRGGRFCNDQAIPWTYNLEQNNLRNFFPEEPEGMFSRAWTTGNSNPPNKFFYSPRPEIEYFLMNLVGFVPETLSLSDALRLEQELHNYHPHDRNFISDLQNRPQMFERRSEWEQHVAATCYQTTDSNGRTYSRWNLPWVKKRGVNKFFSLFTNFLASSPAFSPQPEQ